MNNRAILFAVATLSSLLLAGCGSSTSMPVGVGRGVDDLKHSPCASADGGPCTTMPQDFSPGWREDVERRFGNGVTG